MALKQLLSLIPGSWFGFPFVRARGRVRWIALVVLVILICPRWVSGASYAAGEGEWQTKKSGHLTIVYQESLARLADAVAGHGQAAFSLLNRATRDPYRFATTITLASTGADFSRIAGRNPEHPVAVSLSGQSHVVINVPVYTQTSAEQLRRILVHELAHVYLDQKAGPTVPRWLHEGVAQLAAGESTEREFSGNVFFAALSGNSLSLEELGNAFPAQDPGRTLAYAQSLSVVRFLVHDRFGGSLPLFLKSITGPDREQAVGWYRIPIYVRALEKSWRSDTVSAADWAAALAGTSVFWLVAVLLLMAAWRVKRRRSAEIHQQWESEDFEIVEQYQAEGEEGRPVDYGENERFQ